MIEAKYKYSGEERWNLKEFETEQEMRKFLEEDPKEIEDYKFRPKKTNPIIKYFQNIRNTKKNWNKVKASPYASLELGLKARKIILGLLIPWILFLGYRLVVGVRTSGMMGIIQQVVSGGIIIYIAWKLYSTIPAAKRQLEYYKKNPHTINYCPTNVKEDVDDILRKIKQNQTKSEMEENKDVQKENRSA
jgi:hypothetical protein